MEQKNKCDTCQCYKCDWFHTYQKTRPRMNASRGYCMLPEQYYYVPEPGEVCSFLKETIHNHFNETGNYMEEWQEALSIRQNLKNDIDDYIIAEYWAERITCI